jgi:hypothetical protein
MGGVEIRIIEHFRIKNWTDTSFLTDPVALLRVQFIIDIKKREERLNSPPPSNMVIHIR